MSTAQVSGLVSEGSVGVPEAARLMGVKRTFIYELMGSGQLAFIKLGRRRLIPRRAITDLLGRNLVGTGGAMNA